MRSNSDKLKEMVAGFNDIVEQTYYFEQKLFEWGNKVKANKEKIKKAMGKNEKADVIVDENTAFRATKQVQTNIDFFPDKLKASLTSDQFNKVAEKTVIVNDLNAMVAMLKEYGVPAKKFKEFITVNTKISVEKIDNLVEMGELEIDDLQGCFKVEYEEQIKVIKTK